MKINIVGVPSKAGALYAGTELAPRGLRDAGLIEALIDKGFEVNDIGDIVSQADLSEHNIPPIRNWPAPRMVWEKISEACNEIFQRDAFSIILGGDCSLEVGTFHGFQKVYGENTHLLVLDGHVDTIQPSGEVCMGAAGMGLWFLLHDQKTWWSGGSIETDQVSIIGPVQYPKETNIPKVIPYNQLKSEDYLTVIQTHLHSLTAEHVLVHLDVDVLHKSIMPAAYSPSEEGLNSQQAKEILQLILNDERVKAIEITEYCANKDKDATCAKLIIDLICLLSPKKSAQKSFF
jgi:arginase